MTRGEMEWHLARVVSEGLSAEDVHDFKVPFLCVFTFLFSAAASLTVKPPEGCWLGRAGRGCRRAGGLLSQYSGHARTLPILVVFSVPHIKEQFEMEGRLSLPHGRGPVSMCLR